MQLIEDILTEWSYRVQNGMPSVNDSYHLVILEDILQERKYPRLFIEKLLKNLRKVREDRVRKYSKSAKRVVHIDPEGKTFKKNPDNYTDEMPSTTSSKTTTPTKTIQKSKIPRPEYFNTFSETRNNVIKKGASAILDVANDITKNAINVTGKGVGGPAAFFGESQTTDLINKLGNGTETRSLDEFLNDMLTKPAPDGIKDTPIYDKIDDPDNVKKWLTSAYNGAVSELSDIKSDPDTKFGKQKQPYPLSLTVNDNGMSATRTLIEEKLKKSKEGSSDYNHYKNELSIYDDLVEKAAYKAGGSDGDADTLMLYLDTDGRTRLRAISNKKSIKDIQLNSAASSRSATINHDNTPTYVKKGLKKVLNEAIVESGKLNTGFTSNLRKDIDRMGGMYNEIPDSIFDSFTGRDTFKVNNSYIDAAKKNPLVIEYLKSNPKATVKEAILAVVGNDGAHSVNKDSKVGVVKK